MNRWIIIAALLLSALLPTECVWAQAYRNAVGVPPVDVYQSMLNFAERKDYNKVTGSLKVLSPIVAHITTKFKENPADAITKAIDQADPDAILVGVQNLIVLDIKDLLDEALRQIGSSPDSAKTQVKAARLNYELLSPYVQKKEFSLDLKIKKNFTDSFRALGSESVFTGEKGKVNVEQVKQLWGEIDANLSKVFLSKL